MALTAIEWAKYSWNPWRGCHKLCSACRNCYMFREQKRYGKDPNIVVRAAKPTFNSPLKWKEAGTVFTCSWSDFFIEEADEWRDEAWSIVKATPHLTYLVLTKRPERIHGNVPWDSVWGLDYFDNVWLGTSIWDNSDECARMLSACHSAKAALHFISVEPMLAPLSICDLMFGTKDPQGMSCIGFVNGYGYGYDWVIIGGESDRVDPRPMELDWVRELIAECDGHDIPVFVKQMGTDWARKNNAKDWKGGDMSEWPEDLRRREFPYVRR